MDPYAKEARRQYRLMARSLRIDGLLSRTRNMPISARACDGWAKRLEYLAKTEGTEVAR